MAMNFAQPAEQLLMAMFGKHEVIAVKRDGTLMQALHKYESVIARQAMERVSRRLDGGPNWRSTGVCAIGSHRLPAGERCAHGEC